ncbi:sugar phosphate isomerase/epimerase family protein [Paenibacillus sp. Root444D2]|uniref:sugar phosphate isomerase/epimerase family protein n=1 Tax=Paenibacillus sp. Root444D2 TaxID=1736538 RepID=UPI00070C7017|nr:sugar phosphate isomerase/epimerase family protein [Paenibacillus sp. Root444D2]KQX45732.1 hypothetical protein ASD40_17905 [Paenibacillus sp. Root444D2]
MESKRKFSISTFALIHVPLKEAVKRLVEEGWKGIELMCEDGHREILAWSSEELEWLKTFGIQNDVRWTLHAPIHGINPCAESAVRIEESKKLLLEAGAIAEFLQCSYVVLHAGLYEKQDNHGIEALQDETAALQRCQLFMQDIIKETVSDKFVFALENVPPYPGLLGIEIGFIAQTVEAVNHPRLKVVFDVAHAHLLGEGKCLLGLEQVLPHVIGLHINDNCGDQDNHLAVEDGNIPFPAIVTLLETHQFSGHWVMETCRVEYADSSVKRLQQMGTASLWS